MLAQWGDHRTPAMLKADANGDGWLTVGSSSDFIVNLDASAVSSAIAAFNALHTQYPADIAVSKSPTDKTGVFDGVVDTADQAQMLASWGPCPLTKSGPAPCPSRGDFNKDGKVDTADLSILLTQWGDHRVPGMLKADVNGDGKLITSVGSGFPPILNSDERALETAISQFNALSGTYPADLAATEAPRIKNATFDGVVNDADKQVLTAAWGVCYPTF